MSTICPPSNEELNTFYQVLHQAEYPAALLKITLPYAYNFIPKLTCSTFPKPIPELYNPDMLHQDYLSLITEVKTCFLD